MPGTLRLADGSLIDTANGVRIAPDDAINAPFVQDRSEGEQIEVARRSYIDDLPLEPNQCHVIALVVAYSLFGLVDEDIARVTKLDVSQINTIRESKWYSKFIEHVLANVREFDTNVVRKKINGAAEGAFDAIQHIVKDDKVKADIKLRAAKDLLDRAGHSPKQIFEHHHTVEGALIVRYVDDTNVKQLPEVDVDFAAEPQRSS